MATYLIFPGNGRIAPGEAINFIDAPTLASLYGLSAGEYQIADKNAFSGTENSLQFINLVPREDGLYRNIKIELGDNGTDLHWDTMVNADKHRKEAENDIERYRS